MKLVQPVTDECEFANVKYGQSEVGMQKVDREVLFFQYLIVFGRHNAQYRRISFQIQIRFREPM